MEGCHGNNIAVVADARSSFNRTANVAFLLQFGCDLHDRQLRPQVRPTMSGQSQGSLSFVERTPWARYAYVVLLLVIGALGVWSAWDDASASASLLHHRMFLTGVALAMANITVTLALVPWWGQARTWLIATHLLIMGLYVGLAIATTNWTGVTMRGWWQFWWAYPLMAGQIQQVLKLRRIPPTPRRRSPRLVTASPDALLETGGWHP